MAQRLLPGDALARPRSGRVNELQIALQPIAVGEVTILMAPTRPRERAAAITGSGLPSRTPRPCTRPLVRRGDGDVHPAVVVDVARLVRTRLDPDVLERRQERAEGPRAVGSVQRH